MRTNAITARAARSSIDARLSRTGATYSGCIVWSSSRRSTRPTTRWRPTLIEPLVEPADAPTNIRRTRIMAAAGITGSQVA